MALNIANQRLNFQSKESPLQAAFAKSSDMEWNPDFSSEPPVTAFNQSRRTSSSSSSSVCSENVQELTLDSTSCPSVQELDPNNASCPCERPQQWVVCCFCGYTFQGRVRVRCSLHSNSIYLMDVICCPECGCQVLKEVQPCKNKNA